jgi:hypothetical protein
MAPPALAGAIVSELEALVGDGAPLVVSTPRTVTVIGSPQLSVRSPSQTAFGIFHVVLVV